MVSNAIYGTNPLRNVKDAAVRGALTGGVSGGLGYFADLMEQGDITGALTGVAGSYITSHARIRDPRRGCGSDSPLRKILGYVFSKGYQYRTPEKAEIERKDKFSLWGFLGHTALGAVTGGISSSAFYGAGKGIERLKAGFLAGPNSQNPFYKKGGGSNLDDFMTPHARKHAYNPKLKSTKSKTQFGENINVAKLREDTLLHPDKVIYDSEHNMMKYVKEYDFNISTPDTRTGSHRVFINLAPKAGKTNRNSQFPYYGGNK